MIMSITNYRKILIYIIVFILSLQTSACTSGSGELKFDTIELSKYSREYDLAIPGLMIISTIDETNELEGFISDAANEQLSEVNFNRAFVVAAFSGWRGTIHEGYSIEEIVHQKNEVYIYVTPGNLTGSEEVSSPYHLVKVRKAGSWDQDVTFKLVVEDAIVASTTHYIP